MEWVCSKITALLSEVLKMKSLFIGLIAFAVSSLLACLAYIFVFECFRWDSTLKCADKQFIIAILCALYIITIALILMFTFAVFYVSYPKEIDDDNKIIQKLENIEESQNEIKKIVEKLSGKP